MCSVMVICVLYPRFELLAALGDRRALLSEPAALAPEAGREQVVGEVSAPAEAFGVVRGMRLGEAMSRCPELRLVPPDPEGVRSLWGAVLDRLEGIGAELESDHAGAAFFVAGGLEGIHGGDLAGVLAAARRALGAGARFGAAPSRFAAHAAALQVRPAGPGGYSKRRRESVAVPRLPRSAARRPPAHPSRAAGAARGARAARHPHARRAGCAAVARGGRALRAPGTARARPQPWPGHSARATPAVRAGGRAARPAGGCVGPAAGAGARAADRARARPARAPWALAARRSRCPPVSWPAAPGAPRSRCATRARSRPASGWRLRRSWPSCRRRRSRWRSRSRRSARRRRTRDACSTRRTRCAASRLGEAVRQARQAAGADAALRVLDVDPDSRIPERRAVLAPFPDAS